MNGNSCDRFRQSADPTRASTQYDYTPLRDWLSIFGNSQGELGRPSVSQTPILPELVKSVTMFPFGAASRFGGWRFRAKWEHLSCEKGENLGMRVVTCRLDLLQIPHTEKPSPTRSPTTWCWRAGGPFQMPADGPQWAAQKRGV